MIRKYLDGGATEADGRAGVPVGPSIATSSQSANVFTPKQQSTKVLCYTVTYCAIPKLLNIYLAINNIATEEKVAIKKSAGAINTKGELFLTEEFTNIPVHWMATWV